MSKIKDSDIYPKLEVRVSHKEKEWVTNELAALKEKFSSDGAAIAKNDLLVAALRHGFRYLRSRKRIVS
jgi:hypothetical protein